MTSAVSAEPWALGRGHSRWAESAVLERERENARERQLQIRRFAQTVKAWVERGELIFDGGRSPGCRQGSLLYVVEDCGQSSGMLQLSRQRGPWLRFGTGGGQNWEQIHARHTMELELCYPISKDALRRAPKRKGGRKLVRLGRRGPQPRPWVAIPGSGSQLQRNAGSF